MSAICCCFCNVETEWSAGRLASHLRPGTIEPCPGSGLVVRSASEPSLCSNCGEPLSLLIRSATALSARRHQPQECLRSLRDRIREQEKRLATLIEEFTTHRRGEDE